MKIQRLHTSDDVAAFNPVNIQNKNVFIFVYLESCPYCVQMQPEWATFKDIMKRSNNLQIVEINKNIVNQVIKSDRDFFSDKLKNVHFVPNLSLYTKTNKSFNYIGDRSSDDLLKFTRTVLTKSKPLSQKDRVRRTV
jgi:thioredoxin-related protein